MKESSAGGLRADSAIRPGITIVGLGNWGSSLAAACQSSGIAVREIVRRGSQRRADKNTVSFRRAKLDARIVWLCVPDGVIEEICTDIVAHRTSLKGQILVHSSGALASDVLVAAEKAGAVLASVHPLMSFPTRRPVPLKNVPFAVETRSGSARREINAIIRKLGGNSFSLRAEDKAVYHAAGTLASPMLLTTVVAAEQAAVAARLSRRRARELVGRIALATVGNYLARGAGKSFSGPFARGDSRTIALHLRTLDAHPSLARIYRELARYALEQLPTRNRREIEKLLSIPAKGAKASFR